MFNSHDMHVFYVSMHCKARRYKKEVKDYNDSRQQEGKEVKKPKSVEMDNFQNPQVRKETVSCHLFSLMCLLFII